MHTIYSVSQYQRLAAKFSDCSCDWQMGKKKAKSRAGSKVAPAARDRRSEGEESESGDLSGTSSEKQRLFETRAELREAKQEALRLAGDIQAEDDEAEDDDADDDDDDTHTKEEELATMRTQNADLLRRLHRKTGAATAKLSTWKPNSLQAMSSDAPSFTEPKDVVPVRQFALEWLGYYSFVLHLSKEERKMLTLKEIANHERRHQEFRDTYTTPRFISCTTISTWPLKGFWASPSW